MTAGNKDRWAKFVRIALSTTLVLQSILLLLIVTGISFPAPRFILSPAHAALAKNGLDLTYDSARFNFRGKVEANGLVLRTTHTEALTLMKIEKAKVQLYPWRLLTGSQIVRSIKVEGVDALFRKANEQALVTEVSFSLRNSDKQVVARASGWLGETRLHLSAAVDPSTFLPKGEKKKVPFFKRPEFPAQYIKFTENVEETKRYIGNAESSFTVKISQTEKGRHFSLDCNAKNKKSPKGLSFKEADAHLEISHQDKQWIVVGQPELQLEQAYVTFDGGSGKVDKAKLKVKNDNFSLKKLRKRLQANLTMEEITLEGSYDGKLGSLYSELEILELHQEFRAKTRVQANRFFLDIETEYSRPLESGSLKGTGIIHAEDLHSHRLESLGLLTPQGISLLELNATLGPRFSINEARLRVKGNNVTCRGVKMDRVQATARYLKDGDLVIAPLQIELGDSHASGSYEQNATRDYRFLLKGAVRPVAIDPWMGNWWLRLWQDFKIGESPPVGDFDVSGRWRDSSGNRRKVQGSVKFKSLSYRNLPVKKGTVEIIVDGNHTIARNLDLELEKGWAKGSLIWDKDGESDNRMKIEFSLEGEVVPDHCLDVFGAEARSTLVQFQSETPITIQAEGVTRAESNRSTLQLKAVATQPLTYLNIPLETLSFELNQEDSFTMLDPLVFQFAGGLAKGKLLHRKVDDSPLLGIELELRGAKREQVVQTLRLSSAFSTSTKLDPKTSPPPTSENTLTGEDESSLDFSLIAEGNPNDPKSFQGKGAIDLKDETLGSVPLFGPLTTIIQKNPLPIPSGSVKFNRLTSTYSLQGDYVTFNDMTIFSASSLIRGTGKYRLNNNTIDFKARMYLIGGLSVKIPILRTIAEFLDPLSKFIELELNGPLDNPNWRLAVDPKLF